MLSAFTDPSAWPTWWPNGAGVPPDPIPNSAVKPRSAHGTAPQGAEE